MLILQEYPKIEPFLFYFHMGWAYSEREESETAIKWYDKALLVKH